MRRTLACAMLILALVPLAIGCARGRATTQAEQEAAPEVTTGIPLAPDFRIADIPVPAGFTFDRNESFVFQSSDMDVGRIQYVGKENVGDVAQFYIDEMPRYNWTLLNVAEHRTIMLFFEKPGKSCTVIATPKAMGSIIQASFFPKAPEAMSGSGL